MVSKNDIDIRREIGHALRRFEYKTCVHAEMTNPLQVFPYFIKKARYNLTELLDIIGTVHAHTIDMICHHLDLGISLGLTV